MKESEWWETVCKDRFDKLEDLHRETIGMLRGHNGDPGLLDDMRAVKHSFRVILGIMVLIGTLLATQGVEQLWMYLFRGPQ